MEISFNWSSIYTEYRFLHIFLCLKFYFSSPFFSVYPLQVVDSLLSHSCCHFLHPRISRSFLLLSGGHHCKNFLVNNNNKNNNNKFFHSAIINLRKDPFINCWSHIDPSRRYLNDHLSIIVVPWRQHDKLSAVAVSYLLLGWLCVVWYWNLRCLWWLFQSLYNTQKI